MTHPWQFGWEALVAVGTLGLAAVTAWLVWTTRGLSRSTAAEVAAQARPVLIPGLGGIVPPGPEAPELPILHTIETGRLVVSVRNAGPGTALSLVAELDPGGIATRLGLAALPAGEEYVLEFSEIHSWEQTKRLLLEYTDISGKQFSSEIGLMRVGDASGTYDFDYVRLFDKSIPPVGG